MNRHLIRVPNLWKDRFETQRGNGYKIKDDEYVVALCIDGKHYSTQEWGDRMNRIFLQVPSQVTFVIGGSLGLSEKVIRRANEKLSFSALTFPHQMMRLILCEQIARVV